MEVPSEKLVCLKSRLRDYLPLSHQVYGYTDCVTSGIWSGSGIRFWVDMWPNFTVAAVILDPTVTKAHPSLYGCIIYMVSEEISGAEHLLGQCLDWKSTLLFEALPVPLIPVVETIAKKNGGICKCHNHVQRLILMTLDAEDFRKVPLEDGMRTGPVVPEMAEDVAAKYEYRSETTEKYVKFLLQLNVPSVVLYDSQNEVVGYGLMNYCGSIGMVHVNTAYRGKGYGKLVVSEITELLLKRNLIPFLYAKPDNLAAVNLNTNLGFGEAKGRLFEWVTYSPEHV